MGEDRAALLVEIESLTLDRAFLLIEDRLKRIVEQEKEFLCQDFEEIATAKKRGFIAGLKRALNMRQEVADELRRRQ